MTATTDPAADPVAPSWRAVSASRRGSSHASDMPNQDAVRCEHLSLPDGQDLWLAAVADGHGGVRYVRSDVGAQTAVDVAVESLRQALATSPDVDLSALLRQQVPHIVDGWRAAVKSHADAHRFTETERERAGDPREEDWLTAYGATLLVALVGDQGVAIAQVGDGDALVRSHGFATRPVPGDDRLVAGETTSLCLPTAVDDFRHAFLPASTEPDLVMLATDGYGNSFAHADWWQGLLGDVASFVERIGIRQLEEQLPDWLEESARVGGDDVSAVLVVRRPLAVEPPSTSAASPAVPAPVDRPRTLELPGEDARPPRSEPDAASPRGAGRSWRPPVVAALVVAVVLGVLAALLLLGPDDPATPSDPPSERSSTTPPDGTGTSDVTGEQPGDKAANRGKGNRGKGSRGEGKEPPVVSDPEQGSQRPPGEEPPGDSGDEGQQEPVPGSG